MNNIDWSQEHNFQWAVSRNDEVVFSINKPEIEKGYYLIGPGGFKMSCWTLTQRPVLPPEPLIYTQAMYDTGELPPIGSEVQYNTNSQGDITGIVTHYSTQKNLDGNRGFRVTVHFEHNARMLQDIKPVDTRSDTEKAIDDLAEWLRIDYEDHDKDSDFKNATSIINLIIDGDLTGVTFSGKS